MTDLIKQLNALKLADDKCGLRQNATIDLCIKTVKQYTKTSYDNRHMMRPNWCPLVGKE